MIFDEFQDQRDPDLIKNLTTGFGAREDYLTLYICTAGNRPDVPYLAEYEYAKQIAAGTLVNPEYGAFIFEASPEDPWDDEATWRKAMPGLGISCNLDFIRSECEAAKQQPAKKSWFLQYYLNIDQHYGGAGGWLDDEAWTACNAQQIGFKGQAFGALDMASISDTTSFVIQGENIEGGVDLIPYIWVCEAQIAKRRSAEFDYLAWERSGHMRVTEGEMQDQEKIFADILEACEQYSVSKIAIDRWNTGWMGPRLVEAGIEVVGFGQGFKDMSPAIKEFERLLRARRLRHGGNPVMRWMRANIRCDTDAAGNVKFNKQKSTEKIDGMIAAAMAIGLSMPGVDGDLSGGESVYEKRGVEFF